MRPHDVRSTKYSLGVLGVACPVCSCLCSSTGSQLFGLTCLVASCGVWGMECAVGWSRTCAAVGRSAEHLLLVCMVSAEGTEAGVVYVSRCRRETPVVKDVQRHVGVGRGSDL